MSKLKGMLKSKTIWFALALAVMGVVESQIQVLSPFMSSKLFGLCSLLVSVAVTALRWVTTVPLDEK